MKIVMLGSIDIFFEMYFVLVLSYQPQTIVSVQDSSAPD